MLRWMFALALMFSFQVDAQVDRCDRDLLPDGDADCDYRIVPYASIAYTGGQLELQYPERYTARQLIVAEDWFRLLPYRQGKALPIVFSDKAQRYDLIGRFSDRETGEQFLGLTPVACRDASGSWVIPVPDGGCAASREVEGSCQTQAAVPCKDKDGNSSGVVASVNCNGDAGSCSDCSSAGVACCSSSTTTTAHTSEGAEVVTIKMEKKTDKCR